MKEVVAEEAVVALDQATDLLAGLLSREKVVGLSRRKTRKIQNSRGKTLI
jgi:hypothetical protein